MNPLRLLKNPFIDLLLKTTGTYLGATDANILRAGGIPTARVGLPKAGLPSMDFQLGMNCVAQRDLRELTRMLVVAALNCLGVETGG